MLSVLRIVTALLYFMHGTQKLLNIPPLGRPAPDLLSLSGISGLIELFAGLLLVFGLFTRPLAFLASGHMAAAYWMAHAPRSVYPILNGGELAIMFCFVFFYLFFAGGGPWSLDAKLRKDQF